LSNPPGGLIGSKIRPLRPVSAGSKIPTFNRRVNVTNAAEKARLAVISGVACIVVWAVAALGFNGPGYVHLLLSVGLFLVMWGITFPT
jgi:hypothetical protein